MKKHPELIALIVIGFLIGFFNPQRVKTQDNAREFILTFLPNFHNNRQSPFEHLRRGDSLYIFIYADTEPSSGVIRYYDELGGEYIHNFNIQNPDVPHIFSVAYNGFELRSYNDSQIITSNNDNEKFTKKSFHIKTDKPVVIMGHSQALLTSESFNVYPYEFLGTEYLVMAYNSDGVSGFPGSDEAQSATPSQFAIVATENNTIVDIFPSAPTYINRLNPQRIGLNAGEVYLVQAYAFGSSRNGDLTGTRVNSNKPIALFGGQQRARVPFDLSHQIVSRDVLLEQIPPMKFWNMSFPIVPLPDPVAHFESRMYKDKLRILAAYDGTELFAGDTYFASLNRGEYYELDLTEPFILNATAPVLPMIYRRSAQLSQGGNSVGDPLMQIVPSIDQFSNRQKFYSLDVREPFMASQFVVEHRKVYTEHFATIIAKTNNIDELRLNGMALNTSLFKPIPESDYSYGVIIPQEGLNLLFSTEPVGLFVCGYGYANSYGYFTGRFAPRDDWEPPMLQATDKCFKIEGLITDLGIKEIRVQDGTSMNVDVKIDNFVEGATEVRFVADLINPYLDGSFKIIASDMLLQQVRKDLEIPGFTIAVNNTRYNEDIINIKRRLRTGVKYCMNYTVYNYGKFEQEISLKQFSNASYTTDFPESLTLPPGGAFDFEVCFVSSSDIIAAEELIFYNNCTERVFAQMNFESKGDQNPPEIQLKSDNPCDGFITLQITDDDDWEWGIEKIEYESLLNVRVEVKNDGIYLKEIIFYIIDPYKDTQISFTVADSSGKKVTFFTIIPGFTLEFEGLLPAGSYGYYETYKFPETIIGALNCQHLPIRNFGNYAIELNDINMLENELFTVPQYQLPLKIPSGETRDLLICFRPFTAEGEFDYDTLRLHFRCIDNFIPVAGLPINIALNQDSRCNVPLAITARSVPNTVYLTGSTPNPAENTALIGFGIPDDSAVEIKLFDSIGSEHISINENLIKAGHYEINFDLSRLPAGLYIYTLRTNNNFLLKSLLIQR